MSEESLSRESPPVSLTPKWREVDNVIYFSVVSDGTTGEGWIECSVREGFRISNYAKSMLRSKSFKPTSGVKTDIAVLEGCTFSAEQRITKKIRDEATKRGLQEPSAEVACLIRRMFSDTEIEAMGLWWIVTMHDPIKDSGSDPSRDPSLLSVNRDVGGRWLRAYYDRPGNGWRRGYGFAFSVAQV